MSSLYDVSQVPDLSQYQVSPPPSDLDEASVYGSDDANNDDDHRLQPDDPNDILNWWESESWRRFRALSFSSGREVEVGLDSAAPPTSTTITTTSLEFNSHCRDTDVKPVERTSASPLSAFDAVKNAFKGENGRGSSQSLLIGLEVPRNGHWSAEVPSATSSDITSQIIEGYLSQGSPRLYPGEPEILLPRSFNEPDGVGSSIGSGGYNIGPGRSRQRAVSLPSKKEPESGKGKGKQVRKGPETALDRTIDDMLALDILQRHRASRETDGEATQPKAAHLKTRKDTTPLTRHLQQISQHNARHASVVVEIPEVLSGSSVVSKLWMREKLQERWLRDYKSALAARLARLAAECALEDSQQQQQQQQQQQEHHHQQHHHQQHHHHHHHANHANHAKPETDTDQTSLKINPNVEVEEDAGVLKATYLSRHRRRLTREAMQSCLRAQLQDIRSFLLSTLIGPIQEIESLHLFHSAQQHLLLHSPHPSLLPDLLHSAHTQQTLFAQRTTTYAIPLLDNKLQALSSLLDMAQRACSALETRVNRLSAKDVPSGQDRESTMRWRLEQPEALVYLDKAAHDLAFVRENVSVVLRGLESVERELKQIGNGWLDVQNAWNWGLLVVGEMLMLESSG